jgi:hypothetical protein
MWIFKNTSFFQLGELLVFIFQSWKWIYMVLSEYHINCPLSDFHDMILFEVLSII